MDTDFVIEMDAIGEPCWVIAGGGDPERTTRIECAERYAARNEAAENARALRRKYPNRTFTVKALMT